MEIVLIIIAVFVVALLSVGIAYAISIYKQRTQQKEEPERLQKNYAKQYSPAAAPMLKSQSRTEKRGKSSDSISSHYDPTLSVNTYMASSGGGYSGCSGGSGSSSSCSSNSYSSSCD